MRGNGLGWTAGASGRSNRRGAGRSSKSGR
ncbi:MAG: hypothetical protein K0R61_2642, partial [Microvirga sp.]|nr:hypothetical protein [Microvirga sp.]